MIRGKTINSKTFVETEDTDFLSAGARACTRLFRKFRLIVVLRGFVCVVLEVEDLSDFVVDFGSAKFVLLSDIILRLNT